MRFHCKGLAGCVLVACALLGGGPTLEAAPQADVIQTDLEPLIERAALLPSLFAVEVPHVVSPATHGEWSNDGTRSTWRYSVQIPAAVSVSFHADRIVLPSSATLITKANGATFTYTAKDLHRGEIWSRIGRGNSLSFELSVATADVSRVRFDVSGFQAGFRGLGPDAPNSRHYNALITKNKRVAMAAAAATSAATCRENWACHITPANTGAGQASVAIIVANVAQCSGTLLNNVRGDGTPYVLTARHCQNGDPDGGSPGAARNVTVYWNAMTPCGSPLGRLFDSGASLQRGAVTLVEQQDAWLIRLDQPPVVDDAYYSGWDATGATFVGGFSPHYARGTSRQFLGHYGQAAYGVVPGSAFGVHFDSTLWATVNSVGSSGGGASGSGLFDDNGRLQGVVVRGIREPGTDDGQCPLNPPPVPAIGTAPVLSTALSGIFNSTADSRSTTGSVTLQSVLDPDNTGRRVLDGLAYPPIATLSGNTFPQNFTGQSITLNWTSGRVQSCTASGGEAGDGWAGSSIDTSGTRDVTSIDGGSVRYTLTCSDGQRSVTSHFTVTWTLSTPSVNFGLSQDGVIVYNTPFQVYWRSNVQPCTASGGTTGNGWSGSLPRIGTASVSETTLGDVTLTITCGTGARVATGRTTVRVLPPSANVVADAATLRVGEPVRIRNTSQGLPCTLTGGGAGDGWAGNTTYNGTVLLSESAAGAYTYTMSCGSGAHIATSSASVTFVAGSTPPNVTLTASATSVPRFTTVQFDWDSNVRPCLLTKSGPMNGTFESPTSPLGRISTSEGVLGDYTYTVECGSGPTAAQASVIVSYTGTPFISVFQGPLVAIANNPFLVQYQSNLAPCTFTGGTVGDGWVGTSTEPNGSRYVVESAGGLYTYVLTCGTGALERTAQIVVDVLSKPPSVTVTADRTQQVWGQPVTISWNSDFSPCLATGGVFGDTWTGPVESTGSKTVTQSKEQGAIEYAVHCGTPPISAMGRVSVQFQALPAPTLSASAASIALGESVMLTWASSDGSSCLGSMSGSVWDGWTGSHPANGSLPVRPTVTGNYIFTLKCGLSLTATVNLSVTPLASAQPAATPPTSSGGGGGGAFRASDLAALGILLALGWMRPRRKAVLRAQL